MDLVQDGDIDGFSEWRAAQEVEVFTTCPLSVGAPLRSYSKRVRDIARWGERHGCRGALVLADNRLIDPWLVAQVVVQSTRNLSPLVSVQPTTMHPFTVANLIASFSSLYGRRLFVNWLASGFQNDLSALSDQTPHDERYERLVEFASIVRQLTDGAAVTFEGTYYQVRALKLHRPVDATVRPEFLVSGSSPAGRAASRALGARSVTYALPPEEEHSPALQAGVAAGLRLGIIARDGASEAWRAAYTRFPQDRKGATTRSAAHKVPDSHRHEDIRRLADQRAEAGIPYWTQPFENYQTMCPYLVGSVEQVSAALSRYVQRGFGTFVLDEPESEADLEGARVAFEYARRNILEAA